MHHRLPPESQARVRSASEVIGTLVYKRPLRYAIGQVLLVGSLAFALLLLLYGIAERGATLSAAVAIITVLSAPAATGLLLVQSGKRLARDRGAPIQDDSTAALLAQTEAVARHTSAALLAYASGQDQEATCPVCKSPIRIEPSDEPGAPGQARVRLLCSCGAANGSYVVASPKR